ncbi:hypothetical protein [Adonisia turfae]|uniref:Uncharacterized protein n=1 Tax=Adonisia turfae CCMR0081 TaxID=2292702 RepID=A0A6M0RJS1_9CYAN|nr:hypothetical protein [Adonisia turfae]NEZ56464.1 hypothetical protein [Adonisia turfae CCMR0081]
MVNLYIIVVDVILSGLGGFGAGALCILLFFGDTTPEHRWYILSVSSGIFAAGGFMKALDEIQFFPSLLRVLLSLFRRR